MRGEKRERGFSRREAESSRDIFISRRVLHGRSSCAYTRVCVFRRKFREVCSSRLRSRQFKVKKKKKKTRELTKSEVVATVGR